MFADEVHQLTVFDTATGKVIKRASRLDAENVTSSPAAWLPDGRYVYLAGPALYVSAPSQTSEQLIAKLDLPSNGVVDEASYQLGRSELTVSPDGAQIAFTWLERRKGDFDVHIWVVNTDGSNLHRVTDVPDATSPLTFKYSSPVWSPDGQWVAGVLSVSDASVSPVYPDQPFAGAVVSGTTGCGKSPVFVLPASSSRVAISWPKFDARYGLKVRKGAEAGGVWLTTCGALAWLK